MTCMPFRIFSLEAEVGAKESTIDAHKIVAVRKDELHASKVTSALIITC